MCFLIYFADNCLSLKVFLASPKILGLTKKVDGIFVGLFVFGSKLPHSTELYHLQPYGANCVSSNIINHLHLRRNLNQRFQSIAQFEIFEILVITLSCG